ncbi:putative DNA replication protein [Lactobacillus phage c5]|uniref:DNA replication protein n=1 Tax=Lactobacillus phage c5 TaxID=2892341 RepID=F8J194_9CAUD|nr:replication initiation protein [Lactobacillus phage c5]ACA63332.1 putative DNA replication protein [Lactobacillus phage c5]
MDNKRSYYAIIPANVRYDADVPSSAKLLYGEITALCNEKGYCWASNGYFADLYGVSKVTVSRWIKALVDKGYISTEIEFKENSKEVLHRYIKIVDTPINKNVKGSYQKDNEGINKNVKAPINKNVKENTTYINNTINNTINKKERKKKESKKTTNYDSIINESIQDESVKKEIYEFIKMRKLIKKPMTDRALKGLISKLNELSSNPIDQAKILERSVINDWQSVYPLPSNNNGYRNNNGYQGNTEVKRDGSDYAEFDL